MQCNVQCQYETKSMSFIDRAIHLSSVDGHANDENGACKGRGRFIF